jgi:hypothetical protein
LFFFIAVELEPTFPISESSYCKNEEYFLFSTVLEASMLDKKISDRPVFFELSMGNAGNSLDGHNESTTTHYDGEEELGKVAFKRCNCKVHTFNIFTFRNGGLFCIQ